MSSFRSTALQSPTLVEFEDLCGLLSSFTDAISDYRTWCTHRPLSHIEDAKVANSWDNLIVSLDRLCRWNHAQFFPIDPRPSFSWTGWEQINRFIRYGTYVADDLGDIHRAVLDIVGLFAKQGILPFSDPSTWLQFPISRSCSTQLLTISALVKEPSDPGCEKVLHFPAIRCELAETIESRTAILQENLDEWTYWVLPDGRQFRVSAKQQVPVEKLKAQFVQSEYSTNTRLEPGCAPEAYVELFHKYEETKNATPKFEDFVAQQSVHRRVKIAPPCPTAISAFRKSLDQRERKFLNDVCSLPTTLRSFLKHFEISRSQLCRAGYKPEDIPKPFCRSVQMLCGLATEFIFLQKYFFHKTDARFSLHSTRTRTLPNYDLIEGIFSSLWTLCGRRNLLRPFDSDTPFRVLSFVDLAESGDQQLAALREALARVSDKTHKIDRLKLFGLGPPVAELKQGGLLSNAANSGKRVSNLQVRRYLNDVPSHEKVVRWCKRCKNCVAIPIGHGKKHKYVVEVNELLEYLRKVDPDTAEKLTQKIYYN